MLENPVVSRTTRVVRADIYSDKVSGAENQQERLIEFRGWVIGFVDGEGCFSISFVRQPNRAGRRGYKTGYQVALRFVVSQGVSGVHVRRHDNHRVNIAQYVVDLRSNL